MAQSLPIFHFYHFIFTVNVIRQMVSLFFKVDSNKLWLDVQNEETVICAKFGKVLFNISKVIGRKTNWPPFLAYPIYTVSQKNWATFIFNITLANVGRFLKFF